MRHGIFHLFRMFNLCLSFRYSTRCLDTLEKQLPLNQSECFRNALVLQTVYTTGNSFFAEGLRLCQGPKALPRAKSRALGKDLLCRGPAFAEGLTLGKERPSGSWPSAKTPSAILVCWLTAAEPRQPLPRANRQALGKGF